jgi:putative membrane protein
MRIKLAAAGLVLALASSPAMVDNATPNDAQIAHIAYTAGQIDIKAAELALQKSKNKEVRDFAENMVRDHKAVNEQALALVKKLSVTPEDNDTSKALV